MLLTDIVKRCKTCNIVRQIKMEKGQIEKTRKDILERNNKYHNGRLEVDEILGYATEKNRARIFRLKRKLVKNK
jgi:hypothetical protein